MAQKFIIFKTEEQQLKAIFGDVNFHEDLRFNNGNPIEKTKLRGGGWYYLENNSLYLYGLSTEFGVFNMLNSEDNIVQSILNSKFYNSSIKSIFVTPTSFLGLKKSKEEILESSKMIYENPNFVNSAYSYTANELPEKPEETSEEKIEKSLGVLSHILKFFK